MEAIMVVVFSVNVIQGVIKIMMCKFVPKEPEEDPVDDLEEVKGLLNQM